MSRLDYSKEDPFSHALLILNVQDDPQGEVAKELREIVETFCRALDLEKNSVTFSQLRRFFEKSAKVFEKASEIASRSARVRHGTFLPEAGHPDNEGIGYSRLGPDLTLHHFLKEYAKEERKNAELVRSRGGPTNLYKVREGAARSCLAEDLYPIFRAHIPKGGFDQFEELFDRVIEHATDEEDRASSSRFTRRAYKLGGLYDKGRKLRRRLRIEKDMAPDEKTRVSERLNNIEEKISSIKTN